MKHDYLNEFDKVSLEDLEQFVSMVSMESTMTTMPTIKPGQRLNQFFRKASSYFSGLKLSNVLSSFSGGQDIQSFVTKHGFVDASVKEIIVPESFIGKWVPYSAALKEGSVLAQNIKPAILNYNTTLGAIVASPERLQAVSGIGHSDPTHLGLADHMKSIGNQFFDAGSNHIRRTLGSVIDRADDISVTQKTMNEVIKLDKANPADQIIKAIDRTIDLSSRLTPYLEDGKGVSKQCMDEMIASTMQLAREVEALGTLSYRIRQFNGSLQDSVKSIKK